VCSVKRYMCPPQPLPSTRYETGPVAYHALATCAPRRAPASAVGAGTRAGRVISTAGRTSTVETTGSSPGETLASRCLPRGGFESTWRLRVDDAAAEALGSWLPEGERGSWGALAEGATRPPLRWRTERRASEGAPAEVRFPLRQRLSPRLSTHAARGRSGQAARSDSSGTAEIEVCG